MIERERPEVWDVLEEVIQSIGAVEPRSHAPTASGSRLRTRSLSRD